MAQFKNLEFDGVDPSDYPDFSDAFVVYAEQPDGTPATEDELENIEAGQKPVFIGNLIYKITR